MDRWLVVRKLVLLTYPPTNLFKFFAADFVTAVDIEG